MMNIKDDGYEQFRLAVVERDADAWARIAARYRYLLVSWAAKCPAARFAGEHCDDIADRALARAWAALSPERFAAFPNLAALLAYLRTCVTATAIDAARACAAHERVAQSTERTAPISPDQAVLERLDRAELWQIVANVVKTEAERVVLVDRFVLDLPPRAILARHPTLFADVTTIYAALRNLCDRLQRNQDICRFYNEYRVC
jgi:DNA-directed RNA polymerase specialized sigma24 family protein